MRSRVAWTLGYVLHRVAATEGRGDAQAREFPMIV